MGCDGKSGRWGQIGSRGVQRGVCGWGWGWREMEGTESHEWEERSSQMLLKIANVC